MLNIRAYRAPVSARGRVRRFLVVGALVLALVVGLGGIWSAAYGQTAGPAPSSGVSPSNLPSGVVAVAPSFSFPGLAAPTTACVSPGLLGVPAGTAANSLKVVGSNGGAGGPWTDVPSTANADGTVCFTAQSGASYAFVQVQAGVKLPATGAPASDPRASFLLLLAAAGIPVALAGIALYRRAGRRG